MSTSNTSVLEMQDELLSNAYTFLLTSRLTQDCRLSKNLCSIRLKILIRSPLSFKCALNTIR
jgi:hypothetical protein